MQTKLNIKKYSIISRSNVFFNKIKKDFIKNKYVYLMLLPVVAFYIIFFYVPMYGAQIAFKDFSPIKGIFDSQWVGFKHFISFFKSYYFVRLIKNTFLINVYSIVFAFPAPIILALLINELKNKFFKKTVQTITYLPHFISMVVICGMILDFLSRDGVINNILNYLGIESIPFMILPEWFRTIFVGSDIWQTTGWNSIIYLSALSGINEQLYEAAKIDGANRWKQTINVTLPCILPTIIIMLILRVGNMMSVGSDKVLLLYNPTIYSTADVISTFVYRKGLQDMSYSYSSAIGLFNSIINFTLLLSMNKISKKLSETSLW